jgi:hypothetical protein
MDLPSLLHGRILVWCVMVSAFVVIKNPFVIATHAIPFIFIYLANFGHLWACFFIIALSKSCSTFLVLEPCLLLDSQDVSITCVPFVCSWLVRAPPLVSNCLVNFSLHPKLPFAIVSMLMLMCFFLHYLMFMLLCFLLHDMMFYLRRC